MKFSLPDLFDAWQALGDAVWRLMWTGRTFVILDETERRLRFRSELGEYTIDAIRRGVFRRDRQILSFDGILRVRTRRLEHSEHRLPVPDRKHGRPIGLGKSIDDLQVSGIAARIATLTGTAVVASD